MRSIEIVSQLNQRIYKKNCKKKLVAIVAHIALDAALVNPLTIDASATIFKLAWPYIGTFTAEYLLSTT
jgi:hypothetical protein